MASMQDLMSQIPIDQIAKQLGVDEKTATAAVRAALPTLVSGLEANAQNPAGAHSLAGALSNHGSLLDGGVDVQQINTRDGEKIVHNVFGDSQDQVISTLGGASAGGNDLIKQLLPILAPIVLAYISKQWLGGSGSAAPASGGVLGDLLGGLLRGATEGSSRQSGGDLGSILGGVLGGKTGGTLGFILGARGGKR